MISIIHSFIPNFKATIHIQNFTIHKYLDHNI